MTKYSPSTEEIREAWRNQLVQIGDNRFSFVDEDQADTEFNRWLFLERKRVAQLAIKKERERIFKNLERVTLVDDDRGGVQYERCDVSVEASVQDDGKTLKLFVKGIK